MLSRLLPVICLLHPYWKGDNIPFAESRGMDAVKKGVAVPMDVLKKGVTYDAAGAVKSCIFCRIISRELPSDVVYEDSQFIVFKTIAPASKKHLLICPKEHIQNLQSLSGHKDGLLVRDMIRIARTSLGEDAEGAHYSFHVPPWNSIDHLHLHAIGMPNSMNLLNQLKYSEGAFWCANAQGVADKLEKEGKEKDQNDGKKIEEKEKREIKKEVEREVQRVVQTTVLKDCELDNIMVNSNPYNQFTEGTEGTVNSKEDRGSSRSKL